MLIEHFCGIDAGELPLDVFMARVRLIPKMMAEFRGGDGWGRMKDLAIEEEIAKAKAEEYPDRLDKPI